MLASSAPPDFLPFSPLPLDLSVVTVVVVEVDPPAGAPVPPEPSAPPPCSPPPGVGLGSGTGEVVLDGLVQQVRAGSVVQIPATTPHSARALKGDLHVIEVQYGETIVMEDVELLNIN